MVRFEANLKWTDLLKVLPVDNKPSLKWKITDFNNLMNENPYFCKAIQLVKKSKNFPKFISVVYT